MSALASLIEQLREAKGWSLREVGRETEIAAEKSGFKGKGVTISTLSNMMTNPDVEPNLHNLALIALALDEPLDRFIEAAGYRLRGIGANYERRERVAAMLESLPDEHFDFVEMLINLRSEHKRAVQAFTSTLKNLP
jgi:transcriptional regulator with XRE-family HTH domain